MPQNYHKYNSLAKIDERVLQTHTIVFNMEEGLLKSSSMFPYFMLVAFEGGGLLRALILLLLYPFLCIIGDEIRLKLMVFVCFIGLKKKTFRIGRTVLPKFFLENVGSEGVEVVMRFGMKVGVSNFPRVMVEDFLKDYLGVEDIVGKEIKVVGGYYLGLMENKDKEDDVLKEKFAGLKSQVVGVDCNDKSLKAFPFTCCKEIYLISKADKKNWNYLPKEKYPQPLIFHDGRLAFKPTPLDTLVMFMWLPFGSILCLTRVMIALLLPFKLSTPLLAFIGVSYTSSNPTSPPTSSKQAHDHNNNNDKKSSKGLVYVCNHKTVLDPVYVSYILQTHLTALTYSIARLSDFLAPIKTITLKRDREQDSKIMDEVLSKRHTVVVCPEGTTCREPYLLRFSPLFAEISDNIVPLAIQAEVSMFYGNTASGIKALDPFFLMLNPWPYYHVTFLDKLPKEKTCGGGGMTKFDVANHVQAEIGRALGYKCTDLTRRDKYMMLVGNSGVIRASK